MARRKKEGLLEAIAGATARLPWWAGVLLAVASYLVLHAVAKPVAVTPLQPGQLGFFAASALWQTLAMIGQYLFPMCFLLSAGMSAYKRRQSAQLHADASNRSDAVAQMTWLEFEALVGEFFRRQGYSVVAQGGAGPDGGVDVLLKKGSDRYLVQCKHWRALRVGVQPVRELYGVMAAQRVAGGFVVTSGGFTEEADRFAAGREIKLIDGLSLQRGIRTQAAQMSPPLAPGAVGHRFGVVGPTTLAPETVAPIMEGCPLCDAPMVLRQTRQGATPSRQFWGCSSYAKTKCRGTRALAP
jgi:restriction system protein